MSARTTHTAMLALAAVASLIGPATATVHAVAMYMRTGERTPLVGPDTIRLTSVGAQQAYSQGQMFRSRFIDHSVNDSNPFAPIAEMAANTADASETIVLTPDNWYAASSALAFMQGFYPPHAPAAEQISDLSMILSDSSVVDNPLNGYIYPMVHTASPFTPNSLFVDGSNNCNSWGDSAKNYEQSDDFLATFNSTLDLYGMVGIDVLDPLFSRDTWTYENAYLIWDFVRYQYEHNTTVFDMFNDTGSQNSLSRLRWLADQHEWALNGYLETSGSQIGDNIRAIAGQTLAAKLLGFLQNNVATAGAINKFNLIVGEFNPMMALFSLLSLPHLNSNFYGIPDYGSVLVFELFSADGNGDGDGPADSAITSNTTYPDPDDLWVRFYFRNSSDFGTGLSTDPADSSSDYQAYPIFRRGPSETDMMWSDFQVEMSRIMMNEVSDWCETCASYAVFCPAFEQGVTGSGNSVTASSRSPSRMAPAVAGAIGAMVTLGVALLLALLAALLGARCTRRRGPSASAFAIRRRRRGSSSDLGGFKGSAKLASDQDLSIAKNGAAMGGSAAAVGGGAAPPLPVKGGHERVGSWELREPTSPSSLGETLGKDVEAGWSVQPRSARPDVSRPSFDAGDEHGLSPVYPRSSF